MKKRSRLLPIAAAALFPVTLVVFENGCSSCQKDSDDKPAATASTALPAPTPTPVASAVVVPEEPDAGSDAAVDAGVDAGKHGGGGGSASGSIAQCCAALQQNMNSAPLDQRPYYMAALTACNGARNTPSAQQAFAQVRAFLAGAKMPAACK